MEMLRYGCTALVGTNKVGNLPVDANGQRTVVLGGLNIYNASGAYYTAGPEVKSLFTSTSSLQRRIKAGSLRGELGHPKRNGMPMQQYMQRALAIYEQCVSTLISEVWLDPGLFRGSDGQPIIAIMGKVSPDGPFAEQLERAFNNPKANVCFSIRSLTDDVPRMGRIEKTLKTIITWDQVNEPGLNVATKWNSPSLESLDANEQLIVTPDMIDQLIERRSVINMGMEDADTALLKEIRMDIRSRMPEANEFTMSVGRSLGW